MKLVELSVKRPVGVVMIVLAILALGFVSLRGLAIDLYPKIDLPIAVVSTSYQGAAPQEVEKLISKPLESAVSSIEGIETIQSQSSPGSSLVIMFFNDGVDLDIVLNDVREKVDMVKGFLPEGADTPMVLRFDPQQIPVMWVGLTGDDPLALQGLAEDRIKPYLERSEGVASISIEGGKTEEIQIELDRSKLALHSLTPNQVIMALNGENSAASSGVIEKGDKELQIRVDGEFSSVEDVKNTIISLPAGGQINLTDIADVNKTFKEVKTITKVNEKPAMVLTVQKKSDGNTVAVANGISEAMEELNETLPDGAKLSIVMDTSIFIKQSISSVVNNMMVGGLLSVIVLVFFLRNLRATIIIGISIPIAIISTFTLMYFTGETLNVLSMGGLALGIGMMVDSSIVILENIFTYRQQGRSTVDAAIKGASELGSAVIASTTTSLVVFLPIVFTEGLAAQLFTPLALTVSFSLLSSLVVALTLVPMLSSKMLEKIFAEGSLKEGQFERIFGKVTNFYKLSLEWVLSHRKTTITVTFVALVGSLALTPFIGAEFIPSSDQGQISINVETDSGSTLAETEKATAEVEKVLAEYADAVETNYLSVGGGNFGEGGLLAASNKATFTIQLVDPSYRDITTSGLIKELNEKLPGIPGAEIRVADMSSDMGGGSPIHITISGEDTTILEELADQVTWLVGEIEGVVNLESSASQGRPEVQVEVKRQVAAQYGLTYQQIMTEVRLGFNGQVATRYREDGDELDVKMILPAEKRTEISDLEKMTIQTPTGLLIPLSAIAELKQIEGPTEINRENQQRRVTISGDIDGRDLQSITVDITKALDSMNFPSGYTYAIGGQAEDMAESFSNLGLALIFSIFLVYVVMAVQFESYLHPFVIMFSMPTMLIGVLLGLFITGKSLSVPAFIGVIMLAGIVVNNAIVLVDYINTLRERGFERLEAITEAGASRLRPILMTTLTTVLGMVPLAMGIGKGTEAQAPLAIVVIFGLSMSTMFTLLLVPVVYTLVDDRLKWIKKFSPLRLFKRNKSYTGMKG